MLRSYERRCSGPRDHVNRRILHPGSKAQDKGDSRNRGPAGSLCSCGLLGPSCAILPPGGWGSKDELALPWTINGSMCFSMARDDFQRTTPIDRILVASKLARQSYGTI